MSFDKTIKYRKEFRKEYMGSKKISKNCRNHGLCEYCMDNRIHKEKRDKEKYNQLMKEYRRGD